MKTKLKEKDTQQTIIEYLKIKKIFHYRNNSGAMMGEYNGKRRIVRFGALGSPDIVCIVKGRYVGIEVKGTDGRQRDSQIEFQEQLEKAGGKYILARSLDDVIEQIK